METLICDKNQGDFTGGDLSCTAAALLWGRYCLEKIPNKNDLHKILEAAGRVYQTWSSRTNSYVLPCWKDVVQTHPGVFDGDSDPGVITDCGHPRDTTTS